MTKEDLIDTLTCFGKAFVITLFIISFGVIMFVYCSSLPIEDSIEIVK